jgi:general secretion pathway protein G
MRTRHPSIWLIAIVAAASCVAMLHYRTQEQRAKYLRAGVDIASLQADLEQFRRDFGSYPTTAEGLRALFGGDPEDPGFVRGVVDPQLPTPDPWGHQYLYQSDGHHYVLGSFGPHKGRDPDPGLIVHSN